MNTIARVALTLAKHVLQVARSRSWERVREPRMARGKFHSSVVSTFPSGCLVPLSEFGRSLLYPQLLAMGLETRASFQHTCRAIPLQCEVARTCDDAAQSARMPPPRPHNAFRATQENGRTHLKLLCVASDCVMASGRANRLHHRNPRPAGLEFGVGVFHRPHRPARAVERGHRRRHQRDRRHWRLVPSARRRPLAEKLDDHIVWCENPAQILAAHRKDDEQVSAWQRS